MKEKTKNILNRIFNIFSLAVLIVSIVMLCYVTISKLIGKTPQIFGYSFHFVVSASMEPDIKVGDFVIGKAVDLDKLYEDNLLREEEQKDTVLFVSPDPLDDGIVIVHKIRDIDETEDGYNIYTYGINNPSDDSYPTKEVIGKVVYVSSTLGKLLSPISVIFIILVLGTITIFYLGMKSFIKNYRSLKGNL